MDSTTHGQQEPQSTGDPACGQTAKEVVSQCFSDHRGGSVDGSEGQLRTSQVYSYSIERWLAQKPSGSAWNGLVSCHCNHIHSV